MQIRNRFLAAGLFLLGAFAQVTAQVSAPTAADLQAQTQAMIDATALRAGIADGITNGLTTPQAALVRLKAIASPTGLKLNSAADFAFAATDIGHRLLAAGKPVEAEVLFRAAEAALALLVSQTADTQAQDKAQYLQKLALLRGQYLGNPAQAKLDIERAIALQPTDPSLVTLRNNLARDKAVFFNPTPQG